MSMHPDDARHVAGCAACQMEARPPADVDLGRVWLEVSAQAWSRPRGPIERLASNLLGSPAIARALVTTPSLFRAYMIATVAVLAAGAVFERGTGVPLVRIRWLGWIPTCSTRRLLKAGPRQGHRFGREQPVVLDGTV